MSHTWSLRVSSSIVTSLSQKSGTAAWRESECERLRGLAPVERTDERAVGLLEPV
jgi:Ni,Fe-hydrogenase III component G